ncbi:hypothetical protein ABJI51_05290 [Amycolatopsis sp. NEAU-NG30]|uniref:Uncharacterized protein n=1 Tax=Amycolatopsis melonis TaxID=3156488 RepID=A0ABV0LAF7_9PSEU
MTLPVRGSVAAPAAGAWSLSTPVGRACPYFHPGIRPPQPTADEQLATKADPRCAGVGAKHSYFGL